MWPGNYAAFPGIEKLGLLFPFLYYFCPLSFWFLLLLQYQKLKIAVENETSQKKRLISQKEAALSESAKDQIGAALVKLDERINRLNLILLYYAAGLQHACQVVKEDSSRT